MSHTGVLFQVVPEHTRLTIRIEQMMPGAATNIPRQSAEAHRDMDSGQRFEDRNGMQTPLAGP